MHSMWLKLRLNVDLTDDRFCQVQVSVDDEDLQQQIIDVMRNMEGENLKEDDGNDQPTFRWGATGWTTSVEDGLEGRKLRGGKDY